MKKIITSLAIVINCSAQTFVTIPDANFVTYLQGLIPSAMSGNQLNTSSTLVTTTTHTINVTSLSIANLSGVQYFSSLTYLDCGSNVLTTIPALPTTLTYLACEGNSLTGLPALPNSITYIDCSNNSISALPTLPTSLSNIFCNANSLTTLPALPNSLLYLDCSSNNITSIPALPNSLIQLECTGNSLTTLPALPNSLTVLYCANNNLTGLPNFPAFPTSLQQLYCNNNNIVCFPIFPHSIALLNIDPNPYTCLPNYIHAMPYLDTVNYPICNPCIPATGIDQISAAINDLTIYPNPSKDVLNIEYLGGNENSTVLMTDMLGNVVKQIPFNTEHVTLNIADVSAGVYFITLTTSTISFNKLKKVIITN